MEAKPIFLIGIPCKEPNIVFKEAYNMWQERMPDYYVFVYQSASDVVELKVLNGNFPDIENLK
jgi:hypothetical protein